MGVHGDELLRLLVTHRRNDVAARRELPQERAIHGGRGGRDDDAIVGRVRDVAL